MVALVIDVLLRAHKTDVQGTCTELKQPHAPRQRANRYTFPQLVHNFSEAEAVRLMLLGLRDRDVVDCMSGECALAPDADGLATQLRAIKISDDTAVLTDMSAKLRKGGIFAIEDLEGLSMDELKEAVVALNLNAVQLRRLFAAVSKP